MDKLKRKGLGRLLAYCLGRRPDEFGLVPAPDGSLPLKHLARALAEEPGWGFLREAHLREAAYGAPFEWLEGERIRSAEPGALSGFFSDAPEPPATLYHGARRRAYPVIVERGLTGAEGAPVVMAASPELAERVGRRRDAETLLLEVRAREAAEAGVVFRRAGELLWVAEAVPARFVSGPPLEKVDMPRRAPQKDPEEPAAVELPGSFFPRLPPPPGEPAPQGQRRGRGEPDWKKERRRDRKRDNRDKR